MTSSPCVNAGDSRSHDWGFLLQRSVHVQTCACHVLQDLHRRVLPTSPAVDAESLAPTYCAKSTTGREHGQRNGTSAYRRSRLCLWTASVSSPRLSPGVFTLDEEISCPAFYAPGVVEFSPCLLRRYSAHVRYVSSEMSPFDM